MKKKVIIVLVALMALVLLSCSTPPPAYKYRVIISKTGGGGGSIFHCDTVIWSKPNTMVLKRNSDPLFAEEIVVPENMAVRTTRLK
jgi:hypothetical protein